MNGNVLIFCMFFFGIYVLSILLGLRLISKFSPTTIVCFNAILIYFIALACACLNKHTINFFALSSLYWFLVLSLLMYFGAIYKSISLRVMSNLLMQPEKKDLYESILRTYIKDQSYHNRVEILSTKEMIYELPNQTYALSDTGMAFVEKLIFIQRIFSIKESG